MDDAMTVASVDTVERNVHKTNEWLNQLSSELDTGEEAAWAGLRAYLQVLRDRLTMDEAAQLAAQFPHLIRGVFYEGFDPGHQPEKIRTRDEFLGLIKERATLDDDVQAALLTAAATRVMHDHISEGEYDDVLSELPQEIRELFMYG
jgi:uncharacterized protein (DUF2267 family)